MKPHVINVKSFLRFVVIIRSLRLKTLKTLSHYFIENRNKNKLNSLIAFRNLLKTAQKITRVKRVNQFLATDNKQNGFLKMTANKL